MSVRLDLPPAWKRTPYADSVIFIGVDWSADDLKMEVRNLPGDTGAAVISLSRVTGTAEGLTTTYEPAYPVPDTDLTAPATEIFVRINETTLEGLLVGTPTSAPLQLFYDLHVGNGTAKRVAMHGIFTINPGVTL